MSRISDQTVLITGAASGIGYQTALELSRRGARLIVVDRDESGLQALSELVAGDPDLVGEIAEVVVADLATEEGISRVIEAGTTWPGGVDILINNAGICVVAPVEATKMADFQRLMAVNLMAVISITQGLLPGMLERGGGHVVNVASISGLIGVPGFVAYGTTKYGVVGYSEGLRNELRGRGIRVTVVCPGIVNTPLKQSLTLHGYDDGLRTAIGGYSPARLAGRICAAIESETELITPAGWILWLLKRVFPVWSGHWLSRLQGGVLGKYRRL